MQSTPSRPTSALSRVRALLEEHALDALVLRRRSNFAWLTGGGSSAVDRGSELGVASLVISSAEAWMVTSRIEADRLREEELRGAPFEVVALPWDEDDGARIAQLAGERIGADVAEAGWLDLRARLLHERMLLDEAELTRYRALGPDAADAVEEVCWELSPGVTERDVAAEVARATLRRGIEPAVLLVGADERLQRHRHPLPTDHPVEQEVMVVLCGERDGLFANLTRFVRFAEPDARGLAAHAAVADVLDAAIAATTPGRRYAEVFDDITAAYTRAGHHQEWTLHHQGGPTGYAPRELKASPTTQEQVAVGHAVTWNPSVPGAKCEDTVLILDDGPELITRTDRWPRAVGETARSGLPLPEVLQR